jgi:hypothetical protein
MGKISTSEMPNGNIALEITYGGSDSPFGGVDTSAPPAYIDPRCFAEVDGFLVVDNKLCIANWQELPLPILWGGATPQLIKMGTFFTSTHGQLNYALGVETDLIVGPPASTDYTFFLTSWNYAANGAPQIVGNDQLPLKFFSILQAAVAASLTIFPIQGAFGAAAAAGEVLLEITNNGVSTGSTSFTFSAPTTLAAVVAAIVANINSSSLPVTAVATVDGTGIILTATTAGAAGNLLGVIDGSTNATAGSPPPWYFNLGNGANAVTLQGGVNAINTNPQQIFENISVAEVGGTIYIANVGPMILKYSGPGTFAVSTLFSGQQVIRKFGGSLIGLGQIPAAGTVVQNTDMILSFSAAEDLDVWTPTTPAGLVTGAGFEQLADIGDFLTGLIVSNGTAFIIRSQGISYATVTGNGTDPFYINHIGLGDKGEGSQLPQLVCQYDQTGVFVGNSDVLSVSNGISSIGAKIKSLLFKVIAALANTAQQLGASVCALSLGGDTAPTVVLAVNETIFVYNPTNGTWGVMSIVTSQPINFGSFVVDVISLPTNQRVTGVIQYAPLIAYQFGGTGNLTTQALVLSEGIGSPISVSNPPFVKFPVEEIVFGRDVYIHGLYVAIQGDLTALAQNETLTFTLEGLQNTAIVAGVAQYTQVSITYASLVLSPADYNDVDANPIESQIFSVTQGAGAVTLRSPQLLVTAASLTDTGTALIRITKLGMYASFDPKQRPV